MEKKTDLPPGIVNPFSEAFLDTWQLWKDFRWEEHKFKYKGCISEQMALVQLANLADKNEDAAIAIVRQSIANGWSGFYKLKTVKLNGTGQTDSKNRREELNELHSKRFKRTG